MNPQSQTVVFNGKVFPVVKDYGLYRVLGPSAECVGKYPEPMVGMRQPPHVLSRNKRGRELALVPCQLFDDDVCFFFIDYARKQRGQAHEAIIESNLNMGRPRGIKACAEEFKKEIETNVPPKIRICADGKGGMQILGLLEEEKSRLGEARFNELNLIIHEMEFYSTGGRLVDADDEGEAWKNA